MANLKLAEVIDRHSSAKTLNKAQMHTQKQKINNNKKVVMEIRVVKVSRVAKTNHQLLQNKEE